MRLHDLKSNLIGLRGILRTAVAILTVLPFSTLPAYSAEFVPLGVLDESAPESRALGSSANGSVVVGRSVRDGQQRVFRWTREAGMVELVDAFPDSQSTQVIVSRDGSTVAWHDQFKTTTLWNEAAGYTSLVGFRASALTPDGEVVVGDADESITGGSVIGAPAVWTSDGGYQLIPNPLSNRGGGASYVSSDGDTVAGGLRDDEGPSCPGCQIPFHWNESSGTAVIDLAFDDILGRPHGMSDDGAILFGTSNTLSDEMPGPVGPVRIAGPMSLWRWTEHGGTEVIAEGTADAEYRFPGDFTDPQTLDRRAISTDGAVVAGYRQNEDSSVVEAFRWSESTGMQKLPGLDATALSDVRDMSADGAVVLGRTQLPDTGLQSWLWTEATGAQSLSQIFIRQGLSEDVANWDLGFLELSDSGTALLGSGTNPDGNREAFVIYLDPLVIPEPSSLLLFGSALVCVGLVRRRHCQRTRTLALCLGLATLFATTTSTQAQCWVESGAFGNEDGGCKDLATGLAWSADSRAVFGETYGTVLGEDYYSSDFNTIAYGGYSDWRLPELAEVETALANGLNNHLDFFLDGGITPDDGEYRWVADLVKYRGSYKRYAMRFADGDVVSRISADFPIVVVRGLEPTDDKPGNGNGKGKNKNTSTLSTTSVPEPSSLLLVSLALTSVGLMRSRQRP